VKHISEELTPLHLRCVPCSCPAVYRLENGNLLIIGKRLSPEQAAEVIGKIAADEEAVVISPDYFANL
jgi:hypothetical protein